jgi:hypothetical protein
MSETFSRQEHTVVNVGGDEEGEGGLRLITCVKASQGFDWNQGMSRSMLLLLSLLFPSSVVLATEGG